MRALGDALEVRVLQSADDVSGDALRGVDISDYPLSYQSRLYLGHIVLQFGDIAF